VTDHPDELSASIHAVRNDHSSGAAEIAGQALAILERSFPLRRVVQAAQALCRAQPSMAPVWNAAIHAVAADGNAEAFAAYADRVRRAAAALTRFASGLFADSGRQPLHILTLSASGSVVRVIETLSQTRRVTVSCSESRPALEGRQLTTRLSALGIRVVHYADAALALGLEGADAVLVGADAVGPDALINKTGTLMLGAAAAINGVPMYVVATRDKFAMPALWPHLTVREGRPEDIWDAAPAGTVVRNPYFESVPLDLISAIISDHGVLGSALVGDVCQAMQTDRTLAALDSLLADERHFDLFPLDLP
jgi:translation initiation factor 2B subunit (eIF-2B alpha/beta/delta family)